MFSFIKNVFKSNSPTLLEREVRHERDVRYQQAQGRSYLKQIKQMLVDYTGEDFPISVIDKKGLASANYHEMRIKISENLFDETFVKMAWVISHEYGHLMSPRNMDYVRKTVMHREIEADIFSAVFLALNNIDISELYTHPRYQYREMEGRYRDSTVHLVRFVRIELLKHFYEYANMNLRSCVFSEIMDFVKDAATHATLQHIDYPEDYGRDPCSIMRPV